MNTYRVGLVDSFFLSGACFIHSLVKVKFIGPYMLLIIFAFRGYLVAPAIQALLDRFIVPSSAYLVTLPLSDRVKVFLTPAAEFGDR